MDYLAAACFLLLSISKSCWMETQRLLLPKLMDSILFALSKPQCQLLGDVVAAYVFVVSDMLCCLPASLHGSLSEVPDLAGWGGLDLPHPAGTPHGPGQLGGGLLHRHLSTR